MNAIVGYSGFVGSNLLQFYKFDYFYNSKNFHEAKYKSFNLLFFCGIPAIKWKANKYPNEDTQIIENIKKIVKTINVNKIILVSTIDVYEIVNNEYDEDYKIEFNKNHTYGRNRFLFEEFIISNFENYNIIRLPGLYGKGLKKNIIYDILNNNNIDKIQYNSEFQWYNLDWLKSDISIVLKNNLKICNFFTEPLETIEILKVFKEIYGIDYYQKIKELKINKIVPKYNSLSKYSRLFNSSDKYIRNKGDILEGIYKYFNFKKLNKSKLCVSNICINNVSQIQFACLLKLYGIKNIQIAPTKLIKSWKNLEDLDLSFYKKLGINVYSLQSITYRLNDLNIFDNTYQKLKIHLKRVIDFAEKNNIKVIVFGCPRNRKVINKSLNNNKSFINFFKDLGDYIKDKNVIICLENNSKKYNCNFINTINECSNLVRAIDKKNIKMMVDLGNIMMENDNLEDIDKNLDIIYNIDISHKFMKDFEKIDKSNIYFSNKIKKIKYDKIINLEMLINSKDELYILNKSLENFTYVYSYN